MKVEQITVFLENRSGRLAEVAALLAEAGVNIRATALADAADFGILRLIVNDTEKANQVLKAHGFTVSKTHVVAVAVPDQPGGLAQILAAIIVLAEKSVPVELLSLAEELRRAEVKGAGNHVGRKHLPLRVVGHHRERRAPRREDRARRRHPPRRAPARSRGRDRAPLP